MDSRRRPEGQQKRTANDDRRGQQTMTKTFLLFAKGFLAVARQPKTIRVNDKILRVYIIVITQDAR
jgi:hypothetical protein